MQLESAKTLLIKRKDLLGMASNNYEWVKKDAVVSFLTPSLFLLSHENLLELDENTIQFSRMAYYSNEARWILWQTVFQNILALFQDHDIEVIALKAFAYGEQLYPQRGLRAFGDTDLVVKPENFIKAIKLLLENNFILMEEALENLIASPLKVTEVSLKSPQGTIVEIHQSILPVKNFFRYESAYNLDEDNIWKRAVLFQGNQKPVYNLSLLDTIAHLCLHAATHGLSVEATFTYLDIDSWVRKELDNIDWSQFIQIAKDWKIRSAAFHTFQLCCALYNTPIPDEVCKQLDPGFWSKWRVKQVFSIDSYLSNNQKMIGIRKPKFVRVMLFDNILDLIRILIGGFFPSQKYRKVVYGKRVSMFTHWLTIFRKYGLEL